MPRRMLRIAEILSAIFMAAVAVCMIRQQFASDVVSLFRWEPASGEFTWYKMASRGGGIYMHRESTIAGASDNISVIQAAFPPNKLRVVHQKWPAFGSLDCPVFWFNRYRVTPTLGINAKGLADAWDLQFGCYPAFLVLAVLPAIWLVRQIILIGRNRRSAARGFPVLEPSGDGSKRT